MEEPNGECTMLHERVKILQEIYPGSGALSVAVSGVTGVCLCFGVCITACYAFTRCLPAIKEGREEGEMRTQFLTDLGKG